jgi:hypothetical protein
MVFPLEHLAMNLVPTWPKSGTQDFKTEAAQNIKGRKSMVFEIFEIDRNFNVKCRGGPAPSFPRSWIHPCIRSIVSVLHITAVSFI